MGASNTCLVSQEDKSRMHVSVKGLVIARTGFKILMSLIHGQALGYGQWEYISGQTRQRLDKFYPTNTLVTGPDIMFWVARMIISGYEFMGELPFKNVYFTSILRDDTGKKLSKSLGNSPDPFDLFDEYGTDAVRFGVMLMAPQGLDVLFSKERLE